jgi:hypothetical protein
MEEGSQIRRPKIEILRSSETDFGTWPPSSLKQGEGDRMAGLGES